MAVSKFNVLVFALCGALVPASALANGEVIGLLTRDVAEATVQFGETLVKCEQWKNGSVLTIDFEKLSKLNLSRQQMLMSVAYLGMRNAYQCEHEDRMRLVYALSALDAAKRSYQIGDETIRDVQDGLILPGTRYLELSVDYAKLPSDARKFLEEMVGSDPFDSIKAIESIDAIR